MRVLCATTANDGHFGPVVPFARALAEAGHEVRVAAPASFAGAVERAGFAHEPFADAPPELIGPLMARLMTLDVDEADALVVREVFGRIDAQAGLPAVRSAIERWRPDLVLRESAELASLAAAEQAGVPHVHVCIGMHEVTAGFAEGVAEPLEELARLAGLPAGHLTGALEAEAVLSLVPRELDHPSGEPAEGDAFDRFHQPPGPVDGHALPDWGGREGPLVYVTFGSVTGALPPFAGVFQGALDALADLDARVLMTVGRAVDPEGLGPVPANARVAQWLPQEAVLAQAAVVLGHGGFGTTTGALVAGVPQVVLPLFSFDQRVNAEHVAAVGAGVAAPRGPEHVTTAAAEIPRLLADRTYAAAAARVAAAFAELPRPADAVPVLARLAGVPS
jgi:UDP:flavonoid glycosyltransferase YjiC (YdhE family)